MKRLKREEIYANTYRDLVHLRANMEIFIDQYYNRDPAPLGIGLVSARGVRAWGGIRVSAECRNPAVFADSAADFGSERVVEEEGDLSN